MAQNQNTGNDLQALQMQLLNNLTGQNGGPMGPQSLPGMLNNQHNPSNQSDMTGSTMGSNNFGHMGGANQ